jgi:hypothetical protein
MAALPLLPPAADFIHFKHAVTHLSPARLLRISRYCTGEPYFGMSGANRFDAPSPHSLFKTCYLGRTLAVALAETVLHDEIPVQGRFDIAPSELRGRYVLEFEDDKLKLANLHGTALKRMGGHGDLSGTHDYTTTQQWSLGVFQNPAQFDGFIYMSRHLNSGQAVVLFDRAEHKMRLHRTTELTHFPGFAHAARRLGIIG